MIIYIWIAIVFFVMGQVCLKYDKMNALTTCCYFTITMDYWSFNIRIYLFERERDNPYQNMQSLQEYYFRKPIMDTSIKSAPSLSLFVLLWQVAKPSCFL